MDTEDSSDDDLTLTHRMQKMRRQQQTPPPPPQPPPQPPPPPRKRSKYSVGQSVWHNFSNAGWYSGVVVKANSGVYSVRFSDDELVTDMEEDELEDDKRDSTQEEDSYDGVEDQFDDEDDDEDEVEEEILPRAVSVTTSRVTPRRARPPPATPTPATPTHCEWETERNILLSLRGVTPPRVTPTRNETETVPVVSPLNKYSVGQRVEHTFKEVGLCTGTVVSATSGTYSVLFTDGELLTDMKEDELEVVVDQEQIGFPTIASFLKTCRLENYIDAMESSGWDDVEFLVSEVKSVGDFAKLEQFPIVKIGHREKFFCFLSRLVAP